MSGLTRTADAVSAVVEERARQEEKWGGFDGIQGSCANPEMPNSIRLAVLVEEVGEVGKAMLEGGDIRAELVQVAAVAVAWIEGLGR